MRSTATLRIGALLLGATLIFPALAMGQESGRKSVRGKGNIKVSDYDRSGSGSVDLGVAEIEGRIFKPSVFFVLARRDFQYQGVQFRKTFSDRIITEAMKRPF